MLLIPSPDRLRKKARLAITPRHWLVTTTLPDGLVIRGQNISGYGGRGIYLEGDGIEPEYRSFTRLLPDEGVFLDIGASTGIFGLRAARHFRNKGVVIAVEPVPEVMAVLAKNAELNGLTNVRPRCFCIGETTGSQMLWMNRDQPNSYSMTIREKQATGLSVMVVSVDDLVRWEGVERLDYIKIDAEGAEEEILRGASEAIQRYKPIIQAEVIRREFVPPPGYVIYSADHSPNIVMFPEGHEKIAVAQELGWKRTA
jgi:FkbM family methyltransferase